MKDYVGQWFEIYRRIEEPVDILFLLENSDKTEIIKFPHEMADGTGALHALAERYNWKIQNFNSVKPRKITLLQYTINCFMFLYWAHPRRKNIWPFSFKKTTTSETLHSHYNFSAGATSALITKAKRLNVSLNTLLFYSLNNSISTKFNLANATHSWWIPVNMRSDLGLDINDKSLKKNYVSNFTIDVNSKMSLSDYHSLIGRSLKQKKHWAAWWWQHLGQFMPESIIAIIAKRNINENYYIGAFSNMGEWTCSDSNLNLSFLVNPLLSHPIGAGAIIWNGRLNLGLRIYPTFPLSQPELDELVNDWALSV